MGAQGFLRNLQIGPRALRLGINLWPPFIGAGIKVLHIAPDFSRVKVRMRLRWFNRNYVGTHFGGSLFAMTDPFFALMLMHRLGRDYIVWDKRAQIHFKAPGRGIVTAEFHLDADEVEAVRAQTLGGEKYEPCYSVDVLDEQGTVVARVDKTLYVRRKAGKLRG